MAKKTIRVRSRQTGLTERVTEKAYALFSEHYERLDQPDTPAAPDPAAAPSPPAPPAPNASRTPRPAATPGKE